MLSKTERLYLQGKKKVKPSYKRKLHSTIKFKVIRAFEDFPLLLNLPKKAQYKLFNNDKLIAEAVRAIHTIWNEAQGYFERQERKPSYHAKRIGDLMKRLERAKIPYDVYRLTRDADYRSQLGKKLKHIEKQ